MLQGVELQAEQKCPMLQTVILRSVEFPCRIRDRNFGTLSQGMFDVGLQSELSLVKLIS